MNTLALRAWIHLYGKLFVALLLVGLMVAGCALDDWARG